MSPEPVLLTNLVVAAVLLAAAAAGRSLARRPARWSAALAVLPLLNAAVLAAYVFGEDSYRGNGVSRWDAYRSPGGALGPMFVLSVGLLVACAALLLFAGLRGSDRLFRVTAFAGVLTSLGLVTATILGFTLN